MAKPTGVWSWGLGSGRRLHPAVRVAGAAVGVVMVSGGVASAVGATGTLDLVGALLRGLGFGGFFLGIAVAGRRLGSPQPWWVNLLLVLAMAGFALAPAGGSTSWWARTVQVAAGVVTVTMLVGLVLGVRNERRERANQARRAARASEPRP